MNDLVNHPEYYQGKVECVCTANAIKYLYRWKRKNGKEDLLKAQWYIKHLIEHIDGDSTHA